MRSKTVIEEMVNLASLVGEDMRTINDKLDRIENKLDEIMKSITNPKQKESRP